VLWEILVQLVLREKREQQVQLVLLVQQEPPVAQVLLDELEQLDPLDLQAVQVYLELQGHKVQLDCRELKELLVTLGLLDRKEQQGHRVQLAHQDRLASKGQLGLLV
jgi:hypothetical protein